MNFHGGVLKLRDAQGVDTIIFSMRADEFDEGDTSRKIECNNHSKTSARDLEPRAFTVQDFRAQRGRSHILHRVPSCGQPVLPSVAVELLYPDAGRHTKTARSR